MVSSSARNKKGKEETPDPNTFYRYDHSCFAPGTYGLAGKCSLGNHCLSESPPGQANWMCYNGQQWLAFCDACCVSSEGKLPEADEVLIYDGTIGRFNNRKGKVGPKAKAGRKIPVTMTLTAAVLERLFAEAGGGNRSPIVESVLRQRFSMPQLKGDE